MCPRFHSLRPEVWTRLGFSESAGAAEKDDEGVRSVALLSCPGRNIPLGSGCLRPRGQRLPCQLRKRQDDRQCPSGRYLRSMTGRRHLRQKSLSPQSKDPGPRPRWRGLPHEQQRTTENGHGHAADLGPDAYRLLAGLNLRGRFQGNRNAELSCIIKVVSPAGFEPTTP
jgi:hypothetical protein